jgi:hypothetical protein
MPAYSATLLLLFCGYMHFVQELPKCLSRTSLENEIRDSCFSLGLFE